jgi:trk system potassium uptake protein TrkA
VAGKALKDIHFPSGGIVGTITRGSEIIIPRGEDIIQAGDEVIVFALPEAIAEVEELFA